MRIPRSLRRGQNNGGFQKRRGSALAPLAVGEVAYLAHDLNVDFIFWVRIYCLKNLTENRKVIVLLKIQTRE